MKTGFTYKGVHTSTMGVTLRTKSRPILPEVRQSLLTLPSSDGTFDYSAANEYGRSMYEDRIFTVLLYIQGDNIYDLQRKVSRIASWLMGPGELIFDDMLETVWDANVLSEIDFAPELSGRKALLTVNFRVKPFSRSAFDASKGITLGDGISLGSDVPLDFATAASFTISGTGGEFDAFNYGTAPVRAKFNIMPSGAANTTGIMSLSCRNKEIIINYSLFTAGNGAITVDMGKYTVKQENIDASGTVSGQFFELQPGSNAVMFTAENAQDYTIEVIYEPKFIYGADWVVANA